MRAVRRGVDRNISIFKGVVWLGLAAVLFAAKLFPLAFMLLLAAGAVTAIEVWRDRAVKASNAGRKTRAGPPVRAGALSVDEAASVLGVDEDADAAAIKAAHKRLIAQLHPDRGGSDYLAAKINDARDTLLRDRAD